MPYRKIMLNSLELFRLSELPEETTGRSSRVVEDLVFDKFDCGRLAKNQL